MTERPMRVVHLVDSLGAGGAAALEVTFAENVRQRKVELVVVSLRTCDSEIVTRLRAAGARVVFLDTPCPARTRRLGLVLRLAGLLRETRADVLQTSLAISNIIGVLAAALTRTPVVAVLHATLDETHRHTRKIQRLETLALRSGTARVVAVGESVANSHQQRLGRHVIETVANAVPGADAALAPGQRRALRRELTGDADRHVVMCVGRMVPQKALPDLLKAFALALREHPRAALVLVGDGPERPVVESEIGLLGLGSAVTLLGNRKDVSRLLGAADLFVTASHWEGTPLAVLEAMAAGVPVIGTDVGEVPFLLRAGRGQVVPPGRPELLGRAISRVLSDPERLARMGLAGATYVRDCHSTEGWVDHLGRIYDEVAGLVPAPV
jgi:glycosyltransferase involved in cell wall biosynthesis